MLPSTSAHFVSILKITARKSLLKPKSDHITFLSKKQTCTHTDMHTRNCTMASSSSKNQVLIKAFQAFSHMHQPPLTSLILTLTTVLSHTQQPPFWHPCYSLSTPIILRTFASCSIAKVVPEIPTGLPPPHCLQIFTQNLPSRTPAFPYLKL